MKLAPAKSALRPQTESGFPDGILVSYEQDGTLLIGAVLCFKKQKYQVFNQRGREVELQAIRLHALPGRLPPDCSTIEARTKFLDGTSRAAVAAAAEVDLAEVWDSVRTSTRALSNADLCDLLFGDQSLDHYLALRYALVADAIYFKRDRDGFLPRSESTVGELKHATEVRAEKARLATAALEWFRQRHENPTLPLPEKMLPILELLEEVAAGADHLDNHAHKEAKDFVDRTAEALALDLHGSREQRAFELLLWAHHFTEATNLSLIRYRPSLEFPHAVRKEAETLTIPSCLMECPEVDRSLRLDLRQLACFTVDDVSTKDMDDALSLERTPEGYRLGIHISDVAAMVARESAIDREAENRSTSLYLPDRTVHMLPPELSEDKLSLREGAVRPVLSCLCSIDRSFNLLSAEIRPGLITTARRYSYDEVETLLETDDGDLSVLYNLTSHLESERIARGAQKVFKRDLIIDVDASGYFSLREIDEHGPARGLVGELMVLANSLLARYAVDNKIPVVFRSQEAPDEMGRANTSEVPEGPAADYQGRSKLKKSTVSTEPAPHSGLGLEAYIQATSPIRRFIDLCNQRQILAHLRGAALPYSREDLEDIIQRSETPLTRAGRISKETKRFFLLRYLKRRMTQPSPGKDGKLIEATVLRTDLKNPLVELDEVFLPTLARCTRTVKPGDRITLRIIGIDPALDYVRLEQL